MPDFKLAAEAMRLELCRRSYAEYLAYVQRSPEWKRTRLSNYLAEQVQAFIENKTKNAYDILIIETAPQHGKTTSVTETLPSWYMGTYQTARVIIASYNDDTAERFCRRNKEKIQTFGSALFGVEIGLNRATECELSNKKGRLISRGIMAGITSNAANLVIIDDPIKNRQEADSETYRKRVWEEWVNSIKTRLAAHAKVIIIMTPWHEDDLAARVLASETNVKLVRLPVEAEIGDPLGRQPGEPLCPEFGKDAAWLAQFKAAYINDPTGGHRAWQALYMCSPRIEGGNLVSRSWWKYYDPMEIKVFGTELISVDATFKDNKDNDYVSIQVWGKRDNDYYLRYRMKKHMDFTATLTALRTIKLLFPMAMAVLVEDKANGSAIISTLQSEMFCIPVNPMGGKVSRVNAVSAAIESGHTFLPLNNPWVEDFIDEWSAFPAGKHDDDVDAGSQALSYMLFSSGYIPAPPTEQELQESDYVYDEYVSSDVYDVYSR